MRSLTLLFILTTCSVFAQNYHYGIDRPSSDAPPVVEPEEEEEISDTANMPDEDLYLDSYFLPVSRANELQQALNTHTAVRLEMGNYSGAAITMSSKQRLYGHPGMSKVPKISIEAGSTGVVVLNVESEITFRAGNPISNCLIKNIRFTPLTCTDCTLENNTFINLNRCRLNWDCSNSGYFRNNKIIKHWVHSEWPQIVMKGNSDTPSYGNVTVWQNLLTPHGHGAEIDNVESLTWVGLDAESWNWKGASNKALMYMRNMGDVRLASLTGAHLIANKTPVFDIEAKNLSILGKEISSRGGGNSKVQANTNVFTVSQKEEGYDTTNNGNGFDFMAYFENKDVYFDGAKISSAITGGKLPELKTAILGNKQTPWERPSFDPLPDPLGNTWSQDRNGEEDQSAYIQNLINTQGVAELDEGIYYIGSTLTIKASQGLVGKGTGKTVIVGLTDDFPLITAEGSTIGVSFVLSNMTLQGGKTGLRMRHLGNNRLQVTGCSFNFLVFRDQENGIHFDKFYGMDNNFFDHVNFVNCGKGIYQEIDPNYSGGENATMMYIDKVVFYKSQFINCDVGVSMLAGRLDNLIAWVDCKFDKNRIAADLRYHKGSFFANCDFSNHTGDYVIGESPFLGIYSCKFENNRTNNILNLEGAYFEGSTVLDNIDLFANRNVTGFILNSSLRAGIGSVNSGLLVNSQIGSDSGQSKLVIDIDNGTETVIVDGQSDPHPQYLVNRL